MAERGYREHGRDSDRSYGRRDRESSIFTDENDRWRGQEGGRNEDRGFFDRAGDEVRSWFGDDEAERRRERDARRDEGREGFGGRDNNRGERSFGSERGRYRETWGGGDYSGGQSGRTSERSGYGGFGGARGDHGRNASWDDNYRRWRDQQIEQLDREYDDYCRHRQQQFESDFDTWRNQNRESGGPSQAGERTREASAATTRTTGSEGAGAATAGGGGRSSASTSSTGESNKSTNMSGTESGGRGRSRGSS